jgi:phosphoribosyl 1,2-cyclic phosphodiesterase
MFISALASGSSGNCFYVENSFKGKTDAIIVDAGISCKQILARLSLLNKNQENIRGIFITHEHTDHIKGVDVFARNFNIPIFVPKKIIGSRFICSNENLVVPIKNNETMNIGKMEIQAFSKHHQSADPVSFSISDRITNKKLSVITDAGHACKNVIEAVATSNFLCIESNYDEKMLKDGPYPWPTKKWIGSDIGHLSNIQSAACVLEHANKHLKHLMLCHISENNNTPEIAHHTHFKFLKERSDLRPKLTLSNRYSPTALFKVC